MRGPSLSPKEARHRVSASAEDTSRRGFQRNKVFNDVEKALHVPIRYRNWNCKISTLKAVLVIILLGTLFTLFHSPAVYVSDRPSNFVSRPGFVDRWIRESAATDSRYISMLDVNWDQISNVIEKLTDRERYQGVGLLNFNNGETDQWKQLLPDAEHVVLQLDYLADNVIWESLFPEWIDEEEEFEVPNCPPLPSLQVPGKPRIDLIAVKLPCKKSGKWSRDVARLHFQLVAARLAASAKGFHPVHVLFVTDCFPIPNLFPCKDLVAHEGNAWLYTPNLHGLREKIQLPIGSCELSVPLQAKEISAIGNNATLFNSGVMVVEPSNCTFQLLMDHINEIESYNGGDQGYLNEIFTWWHRIPRHMNFLKHFWEGDEEEKKQMKTRLFGANPPILYVLHYLGNKPWLCFRDYDCNWNVDILQEFASDVAHKTWWKVHDAMPENLQKYCLLRSKQKAQLEWDRRQAEKGNYTNGHWKIKIKDKRLKTCFEEFCFWESMLWHWGEKNWTDNATATATPSPLATKKVSLS
ncbi:putative UDP-glucuronate:xylan alpha-glucuronosyltransferase 3 isoform X2 [Durio zibethinus]|uniref:UDP-glucuronate:xylan alpha-glucuronosyltransferase 3 isoform X2 n=1 Tax=Durio zibethinus TaxID=66656 RepID=A0A6P6B825_DURZI|nr:putative UDP-glucuronate:xylan alpha-glucuronosyltransferase 3 isoform X2 [Durio zibethinus]